MPVYKVPDAIRAILSAQITEAVQRLLRRWDHTGVLAAQVDLDRP